MPSLASSAFDKLKFSHIKIQNFIADNSKQIIAILVLALIFSLGGISANLLLLSTGVITGATFIEYKYKAFSRLSQYIKDTFENIKTFFTAVKELEDDINNLKKGNLDKIIDHELVNGKDHLGNEVKHAADGVADKIGSVLNSGHADSDKHSVLNKLLHKGDKNPHSEDKTDSHDAKESKDKEHSDKGDSATKHHHHHHDASNDPVPSHHHHRSDAKDLFNNAVHLASDAALAHVPGHDLVDDRVKSEIKAAMSEDHQNDTAEDDKSPIEKILEHGLRVAEAVAVVGIPIALAAATGGAVSAPLAGVVVHGIDKLARTGFDAASRDDEELAGAAPEAATEEAVEVIADQNKNVEPEQTHRSVRRTASAHAAPPSIEEESRKPPVTFRDSSHREDEILKSIFKKGDKQASSSDHKHHHHHHKDRSNPVPK